MAIFVLISAFSFFALFILGVRVLQDRGGKPALLFGLYALAASFVSLLELMVRLSETAERARFWANAAFLWPLAPALFLHFVLIATLRKGWLRDFLVSIDYAGSVAMGTLYALYVRSGNALEWRYGWALTSPGPSEWPWAVSSILVSIYVVSSLSLLLFRTLRPGGELAPREQRWIFFAYGFRFGLIVIVQVIARRFNLVLPEMNSLAYAVFAVLVYVGISRAYLLSLTPQRTVGAIISTMEELLFLTSRDHTIVTANQAAGRLLCVDSRKLRGRSLPRLLGLGDGDPLPKEVEVRDGNRQAVTLQMLKSDVSSPSGEPIGIVFLARDVTEDRRREAALRRTLAEKDAVLHELHHRVHNALQTVTSLLHLKAQSACLPEAGQTLTESAQMVQRMAEIHRWAYDVGDIGRLRFDEMLEQLCYDLYQEQRPNGEVQFRVTSEPVVMDLRTAIPLLLLASELISKAFAGAHNGSAGGVVQIEVTPNSDANWELRITTPSAASASSAGDEASASEIAVALAQQAGATVRTTRGAGSTVSMVSWR